MKRTMSPAQAAALARGRETKRLRQAQSKESPKVTAIPTPESPPATEAVTQHGSDIPRKYHELVHEGVTLFVGFFCLFLAEELCPTEAEIDHIFFPLEKIVLRRMRLDPLAATANPDVFDALSVAIGVGLYARRVAPQFSARKGRPVAPVAPAGGGTVSANPGQYVQAPSSSAPRQSPAPTPLAAGGIAGFGGPSVSDVFATISGPARGNGPGSVAGPDLHAAGRA